MKENGLQKCGKSCPYAHKVLIERKKNQLVVVVVGKLVVI